MYSVMTTSCLESYYRASTSSLPILVLSLGLSIFLLLLVFPERSKFRLKFPIQSGSQIIYLASDKYSIIAKFFRHGALKKFYLRPPSVSLRWSRDLVPHSNLFIDYIPCIQCTPLILNSSNLFRPTFMFCVSSYLYHDVTCSCLSDRARLSKSA